MVYMLLACMSTVCPLCVTVCTVYTTCTIYTVGRLNTRSVNEFLVSLKDAKSGKKVRTVKFNCAYYGLPVHAYCIVLYCFMYQVHSYICTVCSLCTVLYMYCMYCIVYI